MSFVFVYITNPTKAVAEKIGMHLLKKKLVACVSIYPISSAYWWKGKLEKQKEWVLLAKTVRKNFAKVKQEVMKMHPYEVTEIAMFSAEANKSYEKWLKESMK